MPRYANGRVIQEKCCSFLVSCINASPRRPRCFPGRGEGRKRNLLCSRVCFKYRIIHFLRVTWPDLHAFHTGIRRRSFRLTPRAACRFGGMPLPAAGAGNGSSQHSLASAKRHFPASTFSSRASCLLFPHISCLLFPPFPPARTLKYSAAVLMQLPVPV